MTLATGYEDWIRYRTADPVTALSRLQMHVQTLMEMASGAKTQADGVLYDPIAINELLKPTNFIMLELNRLEAVVNRVGMARLQPTRRVDGGTFAPPDTGTSFSG